MIVETDNQTFPRKLTAVEKKILFSILPENKPGYKEYRDKIDKLLVIGYGRFGGTNLLLGKEGDEPDLSVSSAPIFAIGTVETNSGIVDVIIHEETDDVIEFDISPSVFRSDDDIKILNCKTYSDWVPGQPAPVDNSEVREVEIAANRFMIAISVTQKKIWLFEYDTGVNHLIPLTNFYNELMRVKNIRDPDRALKPGLFFDQLSLYSDEDLKETLLNYDKYMHKLKLPSDIKSGTTEKPKKRFLKIFSRGKN